MALPLIFTIAFVIILAYVIFRVLSDIAKGAALFLIVLIAYFIVFGSLPNFKQIPFIGKYLSIAKITKIKSFLYGLKIISVGRSADKSLLITVENSGLITLSNFSVYVNGKPANITNKPKDPLYPREVTIIQVDWKKNYQNLTVVTNQVASSL